MRWPDAGCVAGTDRLAEADRFAGALAELSLEVAGLFSALVLVSAAIGVDEVSNEEVLRWAGIEARPLNKSVRLKSMTLGERCQLVPKTTLF